MNSVILTTVALLLVAVGNAQNATICHFSYSSNWGLKFGIAASKWHAQDPRFAKVNLTIRPYALPEWEGEPPASVLETAQKWDTETCDFFVGPGYSEPIIRIASTIKAPILDYGASAVALSDRYRFPHFSRMMPNDNDAVVNLDALLSHLQWNAVSIVATKDAWADSLIASVSKSFAARGAYIEQVIDVPSNDISDEDWEGVFASLRKSGSRIVVIALVHTKEFILKANAVGLTDDFVVVHTEVSRKERGWLPGSLFLTIRSNAAIVEQFFTFAQNNVSDAEYHELEDKVLYDRFSLYPFSPEATAYEASVLDTWWLVYEAVKVGHERGGYFDNISNPLSILPRAQLLRSLVLPSTAALRPGSSLSEKGEPSGSQAGGSAMNMSAVNSLDNNNSRIIGTWMAGGGLALDSTSQIFLLDQEHDIGSPPSDIISRDSDGALSSSEKLLVSGLPVLAVIAIASLVTVYYLHNTNVHRFAPRTEEKPVYLCKAKIYRGNILWETCGNDMIRVVERHNQIIRDLISKNSGYEVVSGKADEFLVVFSRSDDALDFAVATQLHLMMEDWETDALDSYYKGLDSKRSIRKPSTNGTSNGNPMSGDIDDYDEEYDGVWNGPRESISIGMGLMSIDRDVETGRFEYFGPAIEEVSEMCDATKGGQIAISELFVEQLQRPHNVVFTTIGSIRVEGAEVRAMQAIPYALTRRKFVSDMKIGYDRTDLWDDSEIEFSSMESSVA